ncbi:ABC transporter substrate-binding protein [Paenibacillus sp. ACRRX]|uniref:ABC transporter substrate-binding protein n=1 Tax=unclassified Paenibacillus TaxID=185978 RepID=UPI001EF402AA|nr:MULTISPECIES: ABC transporter substrate-binding protein [unclassified Paenibacillus]MCG7409103.1 ABC transporter substrate-binding protein [Paenibacillus sp. ACRRX]MDK8181897.1 ABC transporter substrate-binding protein [Paenibacillus sp. UMB4589-SE434]
MLRVFNRSASKLALAAILVFSSLSTAAVAAPTTTVSKITVTDFAGRSITFDKPVKSVVTLAAGDAQIVAALGGNLVGRPKTSNTKLPKAVLDAAVIGSAHTPNYELITALKPELIIGSKSLNVKDVKALEATGAKVFLTNSESVNEIKESVLKIGQLLGKSERAKATAQAMDVKLQLAGKINKDNPKKALIVYGAPGTLLAAMPDSLPGDLLTRAGGKNVASDFPKMEKMSGYAQLSAERVIASNPDVVFLITHGDPEAVKKAFDAEISKNASWSSLTAVKKDHIVILPSHLFGTNPGTKIFDSLQVLATHLKEAE